MTRLHIAALCAAGVSLACHREPAGEPFQTIGMDEVQGMLGRPGVFVLDANVPEVFEENHLPGAQHVSPARVAGALPPDKDATLVFYCAGPR
jgi:rhodanese-related sulfurtransferase